MVYVRISEQEDWIIIYIYQCFVLVLLVITLIQLLAAKPKYTNDVLGGRGSDDRRRDVSAGDRRRCTCRR